MVGILSHSAEWSLAGYPSRQGVVLWAAIFALVLLWSALNPTDYPTWGLEVFPAVAGAAILFFTRNRFALTRLVYVLILVHCVILMVGGHYTYAEVPLFDMLQEPMGWSRNNYDKLGHLAQGFVPALIAREILLRLSPVDRGGWLNLFVVSICLAISAFYELIEWWVALLSDEAAEAFLGTQGYVWDTQSDMGWALAGAVLALLVLGRLHDRELSLRGFH
jgi:putative membrane protein